MCIWEYVSLKVWVTALKDILKLFVQVAEDRIENGFFESRFELVEVRVILDNNSIVFKLLDIVVSDQGEYGLGKNYTFSGFVKLDQPQVDKLLLFGHLILYSESLDERLESTDHVAEEADSCHLYNHLEQVLVLSHS